MLMGYQIGCLCGRQQRYSEGVLWLILCNVNNAVDVYIFSLRAFYFNTMGGLYESTNTEYAGVTVSK